MNWSSIKIYIYNYLHYYGLWPIATFYKKIHCLNCKYEGKCGIEKSIYAFFIICSLSVYYVWTVRPDNIPVLIEIKKNAILNRAIIIPYLTFFFRAQKYHCPKCRRNEGLPLKLYREIHS